MLDSFSVFLEDCKGLSSRETDLDEGVVGSSLIIDIVLCACARHLLIFCLVLVQHRD